ncbi:MAG TPA: cytochrome c [Vicinamibacterales bacterium]|nr:cytochrome c [Vicinamibacterales bacterium]
MTKTRPVFAVLGIALLGTAYSAVQAQAPQSVNDGIYTAAQADRGKAVFAMTCAGCHGEKAEGGAAGPTLSGPDFTNGYKDGSAGALLNKISSDMPSNAPGSLEPQQYADVFAYVLSVNKYPAGQTEAPKDPAALKDVKMAAPKS